MNVAQIRELTLKANQRRVEHDEEMCVIFQELERACRRESEAFDAIDSLHSASTGEFDLDPEAVQVLNELYAALRTQYLAALKLLRLRQRENAPWESAAK